MYTRCKRSIVFYIKNIFFVIIFNGWEENSIYNIRILQNYIFYATKSKIIIDERREIT